MDLSNYREHSGFLFRGADEMIETARELSLLFAKRRTIREFSSEPVSQEVIEHAIRAAAAAPSGANRQPWLFAVIKSQELKARIRAKAEEQEKLFYEHRAPSDMLEALRPLGTDSCKAFLEHAPYLIAIFARSTQLGPDGRTLPNYYVKESVGIATGMLISALHLSGLATLTHTPSPMTFLNEELGLESQLKPFLLLVCGYPRRPVMVPDIARKPFSEVCRFY